MGAGCCSSVCSTSTHISPRFKRALWMPLAINASMFFVEIIGGVAAGSVSLWADAADFAGDAANYGISLAVLSLGLAWRARAALLKGVSMAAFGLIVTVKTGWAALAGSAPEPMTMGAIAVLALLANLAAAGLLYAYRDGDANMRSVWICSRNDAISNIAVGLAALGVFGTGTAWPDLLVAGLMAVLAITGAWTVLRHARAELDESALPAQEVEPSCGKACASAADHTHPHLH